MDDLEAISLMVLVTGTVPLPPPSLNYLMYLSYCLAKPVSGSRLRCSSFSGAKKVAEGHTAKISNFAELGGRR